MDNILKGFINSQTNAVAITLSHYIIIPRFNFIAAPQEYKLQELHPIHDHLNRRKMWNCMRHCFLSPFFVSTVLCFHLTLSINTIWCLSLLQTCKTIWLERITKKQRPKHNRNQREIQYLSTSRSRSKATVSRFFLVI